MILGIKGTLKLTLITKPKWKKLNKHNSTLPMNNFNINKVSVGIGTYGGIRMFSNTDDKVIIGNYCSIAEDVTFIPGNDHVISNISSFPFKVVALNSNKPEAVSKGNIVIDDDVWIGYGATILSGVHIGQGAIIAAGAVVSKDIPPYAIVGGVPSKVIKYRFNDELIKELLKVDYSKLTKEMISEHIDDLYKELADIKQLDWLPRK